MAAGAERTDVFAWRKPVPLLPLESFDIPELKERSPFEPEQLSALAAPRMAGFAVRRTPEQIRDAMRSGAFDSGTRAYIGELLMQFNCFDMRWFHMHAGVTHYELARAMIHCNVRGRRITEWMNCRVPGYRRVGQWHRVWDVSDRL